MKQYPIILSENYHYYHPNFRHKLPFAATSIHEFYSWPYAKRKANEWMRALEIKKKCIQMIKASYRLNNVDSSMKIFDFDTLKGN